MLYASAKHAAQIKDDDINKVEDLDAQPQDKDVKKKDAHYQKSIISLYQKI